jgi:hypothetical protein
MDVGTDVEEWKALETAVENPVVDRLGEAELEREEDLRPRVYRSLNLRNILVICVVLDEVVEGENVRAIILGHV